jgi:hypothetical protein
MGLPFFILGELQKRIIFEAFAPCVVNAHAGGVPSGDCLTFTHLLIGGLPECQNKQYQIRTEYHEYIKCQGADPGLW